MSVLSFSKDVTALSIRVTYG